jgi:transcriptional regulator with XRE-family HTH domain
MTLAELLKDRRRRRFLTQKALAEQLGVTLNTVQRWEMGTSVPFPKQQQGLVAVLELVPEELLDAITATEADRAKIAA